MPAVRRALPFSVAILGLIAAACGSSTTTSTAPSTISRCSVAVRASHTSIPAAGGAGRLDVTTQRECAWAASSEASWLTINGSSRGQGDGSVEYRAAGNPDPVTRRGAIVLNDQRTEISQEAGECDIRLGAPSAEFPPSGGNGTVRVEASSGMCTWTATPGADWITLTSPSNGKGTASITFTVAATTGPPRTGAIRVGNQQFSVTQSEGCSYTIVPASGSAPAAGGSGRIAVAAAPACPWTAASNASWISITGDASGTGPGDVTFAAAPLAGPARTGTIVVAGQTFTLEQTGACSYQVEPLAHSVAAAGGTITVNVQAAPGCAWSASSAVPWITIPGSASGNGNGSVSFVVAASSEGSRDGTLNVAGQTVTVSQAQGCSFTIRPESQSVPAAGGTGSVEVTTSAGCAWTAASNADWISVTDGPSGTGNGTVRFNVAGTSGTARTGTLTIAGRTFTVNQGDACSATLHPAAVTVAASGGTPTFDVRTAAECNWTASSAESWIRVASGASGSGNGTVRLEIEANTGAPRTGAVAAAGQRFTVAQESGCTIALGASGQNVPAEGGSGTVDVTAAAGCAWTALTEQSWITIANGASGSGGGSVAFTVAANSGPGRTGTIVIGGQTFTVTQAGSCSYAIAPLEQAVSAAGGNIAVNVAASPECAWSAASNVPWMAISGSASGSGDGEVTVGAEPNSGIARVGTATIAGRTFTVRQESGCAYAISPDSRSADADGERDDFTVRTTSAECSWTAVSTVPWITIVGEGRGTGTGRVDYRVERNETGERRTGTIVVEGQVFTVNQRDDDN